MTEFKFAKADLADRPIYVDQGGGHWLFYRCRGDLKCLRFIPFAGSNAASMSVGFYEGMCEAEKIMNFATVFWFSPENFVRAGGVIKP